jgi:hypothetical protein
MDQRAEWLTWLPPQHPVHQRWSSSYPLLVPPPIALVELPHYHFPPGSLYSDWHLKTQPSFGQFLRMHCQPVSTNRCTLAIHCSCLSAQLLQLIKDDLALKTLGIYSSSSECGIEHIEQSMQSTESRAAVAEHSSLVILMRAFFDIYHFRAFFESPLSHIFPHLQLTTLLFFLTNDIPARFLPLSWRQ